MKRDFILGVIDEVIENLTEQHRVNKEAGRLLTVVQINKRIELLKKKREDHLKNQCKIEKLSNEQLEQLLDEGEQKINLYEKEIETINRIYEKEMLQDGDSEIYSTDTMDRYWDVKRKYNDWSERIYAVQEELNNREMDED